MKIDLEKSKQNLLLIETVASQKYLQVVSATVKCSAQDCLLHIHTNLETHSSRAIFCPRRPEFCQRIVNST